MPAMKRPASARVARQSGYRTPFQLFLALFLAGNAPSIWRLRLIEAIQELPPRVVENIPTIGPCRFYFKVLSMMLPPTKLVMARRGLGKSTKGKKARTAQKGLIGRPLIRASYRRCSVWKTSGLGKKGKFKP